MNYYNEFDPKAAAWIRELIKAGLIPKGEVDERDIRDVLPSDVMGFAQCHFFAGIGGWAYALRLAGWPDDRPVWTGSCPCQPFSSAGKGEGFDDERHLWPAFHHLIRIVRPDVVFGEQVASKDGLAWIDLVQTDMEGEGYACAALDLCAASVGAPHIRQRLYWCAESAASQEHASTTGRFHAEPCECRDADDGCADAENANRRAREPRAEAGTRARRVGRIGPPCGRAQDDGGSDPDAQRQEAGGGSVAIGSGLSDEGLPADGWGCYSDRACASDEGLQPGRELGRDSRTGICGPLNGFWSGGRWVPCTDGLLRPVERGVLPLADGLPSRLVHSGDLRPSDVENTAEARGMRLSGYGNAIVPQLAAEFVKAYMEHSQ